MKFALVIAFAIFFSTVASAATKDESLRIDQLEAKVKVLTERLDLLDKNLQGMKRGGFTIVPVVFCQLTTITNETYTATELTKLGGSAAVLEACRAKTNNSPNCDPTRVACK